LRLSIQFEDSIGVSLSLPNSSSATANLSVVGLSRSTRSTVGGGVLGAEALELLLLLGRELVLSSLAAELLVLFRHHFALGPRLVLLLPPCHPLAVHLSSCSTLAHGVTNCVVDMLVLTSWS